MFDRIKSLFRSSGPRRLSPSPANFQKMVKLHYDAATTSEENSRHWVNARELSVLQANTPERRKKLRIRAQYEVDNNCYLGGMVNTVTKDLTGYTAPKLQVTTPDSSLNSAVEVAWNRWARCRTVNLPHSLTLLDRHRRIEGAGFLMVKDDDQTYTDTGYSLCPYVIGDARVTDPDYFNADYLKSDYPFYNDDGVVIDRSTGRPIHYKVIQDEQYLIGSKVSTVDAAYMLQWFIPKRSGQNRGISEIQAALPVSAQLRRYILATLMSAELAASISGVLSTTNPPGEGPAKIADYSSVELVRGMLLSLPDGWSASQFRPEQPIQAFDMFVDKLLCEMGRVLDVPRGIMTGDWSPYNYSSARLAYQDYDDRIKFEREQLIVRILDVLFQMFMKEFWLRNSDLLIRSNRQYEFWIEHSWQFTRRPSIDPQKDAAASTERMANGTSNLIIECAELGQDWEEVLNGQKIILEKKKELGLTNTVEPAIIGNEGKTTPIPNSNGQQTIPSRNGVV